MMSLLRSSVFILLSVMANAAASEAPRVVIYDDTTTQLDHPTDSHAVVQQLRSV